MAEDTGLKITMDFNRVLGRLRKGTNAQQVNEAMRRAMNRSLQEVHRRVVAKLSGEVLNVDEGFLRDQMQTDVSPDGRVGTIGTNLEYAAIHEFGGVTPPHRIEVKDFDSALPISVIASNVRTRGAATVIFRASVNHPGATIPERPYLRPSLAESRDAIKGYVVAELRALTT